MEEMDDFRRDEDSETYKNIDDKNSEGHSDVYENFSQNTTPQEPGCDSAFEGRQVCSASTAAVCLGVLCVLLLVVIIGLCMKHNADKEHSWNNYYNMTMERNQLQSSFNNVTMERDQLKEKFSSMKIICPIGWTRFISSCYFISNFIKTWEESRQECKKKGSDLVIINSREEQSYVSGLSRNFWIGLTDTEREGRWKWVDGTALTFGYWMKGEPNTGRYWNSGIFIRASCVQSTNFYDTLFTWKAVRCDYQRVGICEKIAQCVIQ